MLPSNTEIRLMNQINKLSFKIADESNERINKDYYQFLPYTDVEFLYYNLSYIRNNYKDKTRFLDVGCGVGNIMMIAESLGMNVYGIEYNKLLAKKSIYSSVDNIGKISICDALEFDRYCDFDVIYYYHPIENKELQTELELLIEDNMSIGSILITALKRDRSIDNDIRFKRMTNNCILWQKVA